MNKNNKKISCQAEEYFTLPGENADFSGQMKEKILPIDKDGLCIFHSCNKSWKKQNNFHKYFDQLLTIISRIDNGELEYKSSVGYNDINLSGFYFIGKRLNLKGGKYQNRIDFIDLQLKSYIQLYFEEAVFEDDVFFENTSITEGDIDFTRARFQKEIHITNCTLFQVSFNDTTIKEGFLMNKNSIRKTLEFCGVHIGGKLQIINSKIEQSAYFIASHFNCNSFFIDNVEFGDTVDFSDSIFKEEISIEECHFVEWVKFTNCTFHSSAIFRANIYDNNVYFNSTKPGNKLFYDHIYLNIPNEEEELNGKIIFEQVNFSNIVGEDRKHLLHLSKKGKVIIGSGCIKYRVQTDPVSIPSNNINQNLISELALSFVNYFISSNGFNLGVEFLSKEISQLTIFYFTDEDISIAELKKRLKKSSKGYWDFNIENLVADDPVSTSRWIDNYVSKIGILSKIKLMQEADIWTKDDTEKLLLSIPYSNIEKDKANIYIYQ